MNDDRTTRLHWTDAHRRRWSVVLEPGAVSLRDGDAEVRISEADWVRDIYIAEHGERYIVRFSTVESEVGFIVGAEDAEPLLDHVGAVRGPSPDELAEEEEADERVAPLLFPKVSPLAVWAVICSFLVFVPYLGVLPGIATIALLVRHRRTVRQARAWGHSRMLCRVAVVTMALGSVVHGLAIWGISENRAARHPDFEFLRDAPAEWHIDESGEEGGTDRSSMLAQGSILERDINWPLLAAGLFVVVISLSFHEAAHAISALWLGDDFARRLGRVTLNPVAHIDPVGTIVLPAILFIAGMGVFGWARPVPVQVGQLKRPRRAHVLISVAGPGTNLLLAAASLALMLAIGCLVSIFAPEGRIENFAYVDFSNAVNAEGFALASVVGPVCTILKLSFLVNVFLACFNLIPIPPLDGSWVLANFFPFTVGQFYDRIRPYSLILFIMLIYSGVLKYLLLPVVLILGPGFDLLRSATPY